MAQDRTYEKIRAALRDMDHSALSWNGVNVFGDRKSIDAIRELTNIADRARAMGVYIDESKKIAATREKQLAAALALNAEILAALKAARQFIVNGIDFGFIQMPDPDDPAHQTLPAIDAAIARAEGGNQS